MHKPHPQTAYRKYAVLIDTIFENCDNLLTNGFRSQFSSIPLSLRSESNQHSPVGHCRWGIVAQWRFRSNAAFDYSVIFAHHKTIFQRTIQLFSSASVYFLIKISVWFSSTRISYFFPLQMIRSVRSFHSTCALSSSKVKHSKKTWLQQAVPALFQH